MIVEQAHTWRLRGTWLSTLAGRVVCVAFGDMILARILIDQPAPMVIVYHPLTLGTCVGWRPDPEALRCFWDPLGVQLSAAEAADLSTHWRLVVYPLLQSICPFVPADAAARLALFVATDRAADLH